MASLSKSSESSWSVEAPKASTECETTMVVSMDWQASSIRRKKMVRIFITDEQFTQDIVVKQIAKDTFKSGSKSEGYMHIFLEFV